MGRIPDDRPDDPENVADALAVARARLQSGDVADAVHWVRRAADAAFDANEDQRGLELSKAALALTEDPPAARLATAAPPPLPPPPSPPQPVVSSVPPPLPSARPEAPKAPASATSSVVPPLPATNRVVNHAPRISSPPRRPEATVVPPRRAGGRRNTKPPRPPPRPAAPSIGDDAETRVRPSPLAEPPPTPFSRDESTTIMEMEALLAVHAPAPPPPDPPAVVVEVTTAVTVAPTQALRVALRRDGSTVTVRALGPDGLRDGEREVMLVALDLATDLASLLKP